MSFLIIISTLILAADWSIAVVYWTPIGILALLSLIANASIPISVLSPF